MLEGLIEKLILKYFGDYIENLDKNKLSVGVWSGNLTLEDIVIKSKPINDLKLPFKLIYGRIGKLDIKIPWKSNFSAPTVINIDSVQVVFSLIHQEEWEFLDYISYDAKIAYLNKFAQERIQELQEAFATKEEKSSFSDRVLLKILDNLHVNFTNIHIRVEEKLKAPFYSIGVTLQEMIVVNTNDNWVEQFIDRNKDKNIDVYKLLKISNFGLYLKSNENYFLSQEGFTKDIIKSKMKEIFPIDSKSAVGIEYLIKPISLTAKLKQNNLSNNLPTNQERILTDTESSFSNSAKANLWINLDNFDIDVEKIQFDCIIRTLNHISNYQRFQLNYFQTRKFRPFRPKRKILNTAVSTDDVLKSERVKNQNAILWWKFAKEMTIKKLKYAKGDYKVFDLSKEYLENCRLIFVELYNKFYKNPSSLTTQEFDSFSDIIEIVELQELFVWVKPVLQELYKESKKEENKKAKTGIFKKMFGNKLTDQDLLSKEDEEKIEEILENSVKEATNQILMADVETKIQVDFALNNGSFSFSKSYSKGMANSTEGFSFKYKDLLFSLRKGEYFTEIDSELKEFNIDMFTIINKNIISIPITFKNFTEEIRKNSFISLDTIDFSKNASMIDNSFLLENIDENFVWRFSLKKISSATEKSSKLFFQINSLNIIYHQVLLERILSFFKVDVNEDLANTAWDKINEIKETTQESLKDVLENKNVIEMKIMPRKVIIPINKYDLKNSRMLILEIGKMNFYNAPSGEEKYNRMYNLDVTKITLAHYNSFNEMRFNKRRFELITDISARLGFALLNPKFTSNDLASFKLIVNIDNITINLTDYLYATLMYIIDIFKPAQEADLWSQLNQDKNEIKKNCKIFGKILKKNQIYRNWEEYFAVLSSGYIYFYKSVDEDDHSGYYYIKDAQLIDSSEDPLLLSLKNLFGMIEIKFPNEVKSKQWTLALRERIHEMKTSFEAISEEISRNVKVSKTNEIYFGLELNLKQAVAYLYSDDAKNMRSSNSSFEKMFTIGFVNFHLELILRQLDTEIKMYLQGIKILDDLYKTREFRQILDSTDPEDKDLKLVNIEIFVCDETSPNYKNTQIDINIQIGYLYAIWSPIVLRRLLSFLAHNDILRNKVLREIQVSIDKQIDEKFISPVKEEVIQRQVCSEHKYTYIKLNTILKRVRVVWIQPNLNFMFMEVRLGYSVLNLDMKVDHFTLNGELGNTQLIDLSNYPFTIKSQSEFSVLNAKEILGAKENSSSLITFEYKSMNTWCPHCEDNYTTEANVNINSITLLYIQEHFMRFFNYLFSEFLGALGPNEEVKEFRNEKNQIVATTDLSELEKMKLNVTINNPQAILKPRAHFKEYFLINAGTVIITCTYDKENNKIRMQPEKWRWTTTYHFDIKNFFIVTHDNFTLCDPTNAIVNMHFTYLTEEDKLMTDLECDKSFQIDLFFHNINVNLRQIDFTNVMRLNDLNILYTDEQEECYNYEHLYANKKLEIKEEITRVADSPKDEKNTNINNDELIKNYYHMFFVLFIPNISLKLFLNNRPFSELSLVDKQLTFTSKVNRTKEVDISISSLEIFHFIDEVHKEIILSDFSHPIQEFDNIIQDVNINLKNKIIPKGKQRRNTAIVKNEKIINMSCLSQAILKEFLSCIKQTSKISDKVHNLKIIIEEDREKSYIIKLRGMKLIIGNTSIILLKQFFLEGFPFYNKDDRDLPNLYDSNEDNNPGMKVYLEIQNPLICFLSDEIDKREQDLICLSCEIVVGYKKEKISKVKNELLFNYEELNQIKSLVEDEAQKEHLINAIINDKANVYSLTVSLFEICPFITNLNDVLFSELLVIPKRKLIENFMFTYASHTQMRYIPSNTYLLNNVSKLDLNKMTIKASYRDIVLMLKSIDHINKQMDEDYLKNYDNMTSYTRTKTILEVNEKSNKAKNKENPAGEVEINDIRNLNMINKKSNNNFRYSLPFSGFIREDDMRKSISITELVEESTVRENNNIEHEEYLEDTDEMINISANKVEHHKSLAIKQSSFQKFKPIDQLIDKGISTTTIMSQGIQLILIDDHANTFYPFLSLVINELILTNEFLNFNQNIINSSFVVKVLVYNYIAGSWEPLIEKCKINFEITDDRSDDKVHTKTINLNIPTPLDKPYMAFNINLSDISVSFLYMTFNSWIDKYFKLINNYSVEIKKLIQIENEKSMTISNHTVFNFTGRKLHLYKLDKQNNLRVNKLCDIEVNQSYDIEYFDENKDYYDPSVEVTQNLLKENHIYFELDGVKTKENVLKIDNIQTKTHLINYSELRSNLGLSTKEELNKYEFIVSQVKFQDLRKFIYFYPPVSFKNKTQHLIVISLVRKGLSNFFIFLESRNTVGIPYEYLEGQIEFQYENSNPNVFPVKNFLSKSVIKQDLIFKNAFLNLSFVANENAKHRVITVNHTYCIRNCLPFDITVVLIKTKQLYIIPKGEKFFLDALSINDNILVCIFFLNFRTEKEVILYNIKEPTKLNKTFNVLDDKNSSLNLFATIIPGDTITAIIHSNGLIINNTLMEIKFFYGKNKKKANEVAGQKEIANVLLLSEEKHLYLDCNGFISDPFNVTVLGISRVVECKKGCQVIEFIIECNLSLVAQDLDIYTNIVTFSPRFILCNQMNLPILVSLYKNGSESELIRPNDKKAFYFFNKGSENSICLRLIEAPDKIQGTSKWNWSEPISLLSDGLLTIQINGANLHEKIFVNLEKKIESFSTLVMIKDTDYHNCQFYVENYSSYISFKIWQQNYESNADYINNRSKSIFAWTNSRDKKIVNVKFFVGSINNKPLSIESELLRRYEISDEYVTFLSSSELDKEKNSNVLMKVYPASEMIQIKTSLYNGYSVRLHISSDGMRKFLKITDITHEVPILSNNLIRLTELHVKIDKLGISLMADNRHMKENKHKYKRNEIVYISLKDIMFYTKKQVTEETSKTDLQLKINDVEIDNEYSYLSHFPIIMRPVNSSKFLKKEELSNNLPPFFNCAVFLVKNKNDDITKILLLNYLIQSYYFTIDSNVIVGMLNFFQNLTLDMKTSVTSINPLFLDNKTNLENGIFIKDNYFDPTWLNKQQTKEKWKLFIQKLEMSPIEIILSFIAQTKDKVFSKLLQSNRAVSSLLSTFTNIENAPILLNGSQMYNVYGDLNQIMQTVYLNYKQSLLMQVMKLFGSIDILGNPTNLLHNLGTGFKDFFEKPAKGIVKGPLEGAKGVLDGSLSLVKHTVEGTFTTTSKITSGLSKGILYITQDEEYINEREKKKITEKPKNFVEGIGYGLSSMAGGIFYGVSDIVVKPIQGAKKDKWAGFGKGMLQGLAGIVVKPISGVLELVSKTTEGIKNTVNDDDKIKMERIPRPFYGKFQFIKSYNIYHARVIEILTNKIEHFKNHSIDFYSSEIYKNKKGDNILIVFSTTSIYIIDVSKKELKTILNYKDIKDIYLESADKIRITFKREINKKFKTKINFGNSNVTPEHILNRIKDAMDNNYEEN